MLDYSQGMKLGGSGEGEEGGLASSPFMAVVTLTICRTRKQAALCYKALKLKHLWEHAYGTSCGKSLPLFQMCPLPARRSETIVDRQRPCPGPYGRSTYARSIAGDEVAPDARGRAGFPLGCSCGQPWGGLPRAGPGLVLHQDAQPPGLLCHNLKSQPL